MCNIALLVASGLDRVHIYFWIPDDRNNLERLTLAVLSHVPTAVLYVHDLSGECGTSPDDQVWHLNFLPLLLFFLFMMSGLSFSLQKKGMSG